MESRAAVVSFLVRLAFAIVTACVIAALVVQDHTSRLPLGVFNVGAEQLARLADACLVLFVLTLVVQVVELATGRMARVCGLVRGAYVFVAILDVLLLLGERFLVPVNPAGLLGYSYEVPSSGRPPVILKRRLTGARLDSCLVESGRAPQGPRVLLLGDSYTEGSGRSRECNYPDVVEHTLRERWDQNAWVVNAGVSGHGPLESLSLLRWYRNNACPVDAIVFNMFLENDFSDNLPGMERRVVAGVIYRFPRSWFLRTFHPLNTRTFRWALTLAVFRRAAVPDTRDAVGVGAGPCDPVQEPQRGASPFLRAMVERGLINAGRVAALPGGRSESVEAIEEMRSIAGEMGVPFVLVLFPDRVLVDTELQRLMHVGHDRLAPALENRLLLTETFPPETVLDVTGVLAGRTGMYRKGDTHLSDAGNVVAGRFVGEALAARLRR